MIGAFYSNASAVISAARELNVSLQTCPRWLLRLVFGRFFLQDLDRLNEAVGKYEAIEERAVIRTAGSAKL